MDEYIVCLHKWQDEDKEAQRKIAERNQRLHEERVTITKTAICIALVVVSGFESLITFGTPLSLLGAVGMVGSFVGLLRL